jgi:hypothetical protein
MSIKLGLYSKLYRNTGTYDVPVVSGNLRPQGERGGHEWLHYATIRRLAEYHPASARAQADSSATACGSAVKGGRRLPRI